MEFDLRATVKSAISVVDDILGDGFSIGLHQISGNSGTAKTAFFVNIAQKSEFPTIFLNAEMNARDLLKRFVTASTKVELNKINLLPPDERNRLVDLTKTAIAHVEVEDGNAGFVSINYLKNRIADIVEEKHPDTILLIIDSFNAWMTTAKTSIELPDEELRAKLIADLIDLSKEFNVTILTSTQKMEESKETIKALEFASNTHLEFQWEKDGRPDSEGNKILSIKFNKNRSGQSGKNKIVKFKGDTQEFL